MQLQTLLYTSLFFSRSAIIQRGLFRPVSEMRYFHFLRPSNPSDETTISLAHTHSHSQQSAYSLNTYEVISPWGQESVKEARRESIQVRGNMGWLKESGEDEEYQENLHSGASVHDHGRRFLKEVPGVSFTRHDEDDVETALSYYFPWFKHNYTYSALDLTLRCHSIKNPRRHRSEKERSFSIICRDPVQINDHPTNGHCQSSKAKPRTWTKMWSTKYDMIARPWNKECNYCSNNAHSSYSRIGQLNVITSPVVKFLTEKSWSTFSSVVNPGQGWDRTLWMYNVKWHRTWSIWLSRDLEVKEEEENPSPYGVEVS